jgi:hypothetical protein
MTSNELDDMHQEMTRSGARVYAVLLAVLRQVAEARKDALRRVEAQALAELREGKPGPQAQLWAGDIKGWVAANVDGDQVRVQAWDKHLREAWGIDPDAARDDARRLEEGYGGDLAKLRADVVDLVGEDFVRDLEDEHRGTGTDADGRVAAAVEIEVRRGDRRVVAAQERGGNASALEPGEAAAEDEQKALGRQNGVWQNGSESARLAGAGFDRVLGTHGHNNDAAPDVPREGKLRSIARRARRGAAREQENINDLGR